MPVSAFGINHQHSPIEIRERLAFSGDCIENALGTLLQQPDIDEAVIVSTCNRTEIYTNTTSTQSQAIQQWLIEYHELQDIDVSSYSYHHHGLAAVRHLMRVASGLDSMIVGEPQILGQIKEAFHLACQHGSVGEQLRPLFPAVFATSKHVRSATHIGRCPVSIAHAVTKLCQQHVAALNQANVLFIGAGTTIELVATYLQDRGINKLYIANRTHEHAQALAERYNGEALCLGAIPHYLQHIDIIISATASQLPILSKAVVERAQQQREQRPLFIADLAVPRDVAADVAQLSHITLYNIDDLRGVVNANMQDRLSAAEQAEAMIELYAANYMRELRIHDAGDMIRHYRAALIKQRDSELDKAMNALKAGKNPEAVLKNFARNFVNKVMHHPTITLRQAACDGHANLLTLAKELFK